MSEAGAAYDSGEAGEAGHTFDQEAAETGKRAVANPSPDDARAHQGAAGGAGRTLDQEAAKTREPAGANAPQGNHSPDETVEIPAAAGDKPHLSDQGAANQQHPPVENVSPEESFRRYREAVQKMKRKIDKEWQVWLPNGNDSFVKNMYGKWKTLVEEEIKYLENTTSTDLHVRSGLFHAMRYYEMHARQKLMQYITPSPLEMWWDLSPSNAGDREADARQAYYENIFGYMKTAWELWRESKRDMMDYLCKDGDIFKRHTLVPVLSWNAKPNEDVLVAEEELYYTQAFDQLKKQLSPFTDAHEKLVMALQEVTTTMKSQHATTKSQHATMKSRDDKKTFITATGNGVSESAIGMQVSEPDERTDVTEALVSAMAKAACSAQPQSPENTPHKLFVWNIPKPTKAKSQVKQPQPRDSAAKISVRGKQVIIVSWHGPYKNVGSEIERANITETLLLDSIKNLRETHHDWKGIPVIVCGDFNDGGETAKRCATHTKWSEFRLAVSAPATTASGFDLQGDNRDGHIDAILYLGCEFVHGSQQVLEFPWAAMAINNKSRHRALVAFFDLDPPLTARWKYTHQYDGTVEKWIRKQVIVRPGSEEHDADTGVDWQKVSSLEVVSEGGQRPTWTWNTPEPNLKELKLCGIKLSHCRSFGNLEFLTLCDCADVQDIPGLGSCRYLRKLDVSGTGIKDLKMLSLPASLEMFDCSNTQVTSLEPLKECTNLTRLIICNCKALRDLSPLSTMTHLEEIRATRSGVTVINGSTGFPMLRVLDVEQNVREAFLIQYWQCQRGMMYTGKRLTRTVDDLQRLLFQTQDGQFGYVDNVNITIMWRAVCSDDGSAGVPSTPQGAAYTPQKFTFANGHSVPVFRDQNGNFFMRDRGIPYYLTEPAPSYDSV